MSTITVDRDPSYAPCGYLICQVKGEPGSYDWDTRDDTTTRLVSVDWDHPGLAQSFGWQPCDCGCTDGTVDCDHKTASAMIEDAGNFLDSLNHANDSAYIEDPGYF
jgi:hypothetical protein